MHKMKYCFSVLVFSVYCFNIIKFLKRRENGWMKCRANDQETKIQEILVEKHHNFLTTGMWTLKIHLYNKQQKRYIYPNKQRFCRIFKPTFTYLSLDCQERFFWKKKLITKLSISSVLSVLIYNLFASYSRTSHCNIFSVIIYLAFIVFKLLWRS